MKILTTNFLTCAVKTCKSSPTSFPLHPQSATLARSEIDYNPTLLLNLLPRLSFDALSTIATELSLQAMLPSQEAVDALSEKLTSAEEVDEESAEVEELLRKLHVFLLETNIMEGKLCCANCGFEYPIKEGVGNFLLPSHLV
jgi:multifunctional methyltransferase subunit TRM112